MRILNKSANLEMAVRNREQVSHILLNLIQRVNTIEQTVVTTPFISDSIVDGVTTIAPSQNAVFDALLAKANNSEVLHNTGPQVLNGDLTINTSANIPGLTVNSNGDGIFAVTANSLNAAIVAQSVGGGKIAKFYNSVAEVTSIDNNGNITANSFIKEGALPTDILMGDGSTTSLTNISLVETDTLQSVTGRGDTTTNDVTFDSTVFLPNLAGLPDQPTNIGVDIAGAIVSIPTEVSATGAVQILATNKTGVTIDKGSVVYINGAQGSKATIALALADSDIITSQAVGIVTADIPNNGSGYVTILGEITGLDTSSFTNGEKVFLSPTVSGELTNVIPTSPNNVVFIGTISNAHSTQGKVIINIIYTSKLDRLVDVAITGTPNRALLMYDNGTALWKNSFLNSLDVTTALGYTPENITNKGLPNGYASLDVSGLIPLTQLPPSAIERLVVVANQAARFALNTSQVQNGDTVKEIDTGLMYYVKDQTNLGNANGYEVYRAGSAASVPWSGVTGTPTTLAGYGITDALTTSRVLNINGVALDLTVNREWRTAQADTGVLTFAGLATNSATTINIGAVSGFIIDNETNPDSPTYTKITYPGEGAKAVTSVGTGTSSYVMLGVGNVITFQNTFPTSAERKAKIWLGKVSHPAGSITLVVNEPDYITSPMAFSRDMLQALGGYINTGVFPYANGANLSINITGASIVGDGINFVLSRTNPNQILIPAGVAQAFQYRTQLGGVTGAVTTITPGFYDLGGVITAIPGANQRSSIQYVFCVPGIGYVIQYGQNWYDTLLDAVAAVGKEAFVKFPNLTNNAILIGVIVARKDATQLNNTAQARIYNADRLGGLIGSTSGTSTTTLQLAYNNSVEPEIITNTTNGAFTLQRGSAADADNVLEIKNGVGTATSKILGNGNIDTLGTIRSTGRNNPTSGVGLELRWDDSVTSSLGLGASSVLSFDRDGGTYKALQIKGSEILFDISNVPAAKITNGTRNLLINTTTDNGVDKLQVNGSALVDGLKYTQGINITSTDLNNLFTAGFYYGSNLTNAPDVNFFFVTVERFSVNTYVHQTATSFGTVHTPNRIYSRTRENGAWGAWAEIQTTQSPNTATVVAGTTYTLLATDISKQVIFSSNSPVTVTIPLGLPTGFVCEAYQQGTGQLSFITPVGGTLRYQSYELPQSEAQYSILGIEGIVNMTDTYKLYGQLTSI